MFQVALNGLTKNSSGADHVWCVIGCGEFHGDLTHEQATSKAAALNSRLHPTGAPK